MTPKERDRRIARMDKDLEAAERTYRQERDGKGDLTLTAEDLRNMRRDVKRRKVELTDEVRKTKDNAT